MHPLFDLMQFANARVALLQFILPALYTVQECYDAWKTSTVGGGPSLDQLSKNSSIYALGKVCTGYEKKIRRSLKIVQRVEAVQVEHGCDVNEAIRLVQADIGARSALSYAENL